ncbi:MULTISPECIES: DUF742 domain-containing protein [unclassified Streptomyces]|uniref:DUF742 domain-containing protein n=1 Tax=unclassified Streptomyces TaxID=2593676 RepID=UPI00224FDE46|nr:DUF742 domain-containing protein [Streptomyces sp. NBC_00338]MCX5143164.1 DUF742 domain-containing protein [Streptomyces sp. NBC_00338]WSU61582.1 DUF742 domain-containing protein [Streptomyces sp. NBC_01104]
MGTPPGGHQFNGGQQVPGEHGDHGYGFPSTPGRQGAQQPYQPYRQPQQPQPPQHVRGSDWPQQPQQPNRPQRPHRYDSPQQPPRIQPVQPRRAPEPAAPAAHNPLVRPYAMTGGRTRPRYQLAIEALVSTTADPSRLQGQLPEHQRICRLCIEIKSVAEISALLSIPLGVARILVADLAEAGLVAIHQPGGDESAGGQPDVTLLERVLSGLRKL